MAGLNKAYIRISLAQCLQEPVTEGVFSQRAGCHKKNRMACAVFVTQLSKIYLLCVQKMLFCNEANKHVSEKLYFSQR